MASLYADALDLSDRLTALRRAIHGEPELGLHTPRTMAKVRDSLAHLPLEWRQGPSTTGAVALLRGGAATGRTVLLRGDMDALPMGEETGLPFASTIPGAMHACGHDAHTAMLTGAVELLAARADTLPGDVLFMFQPGEEGHHGARFMIEDGLIETAAGRAPDAAFALHVMPNAPHGQVQGRAGALMASADQIDITVTGAGGHASMPHHAADPIPVACEIVTAIQAMVTRQFDAHDPVVVTIARIEAGSAHNVIPDAAHMRGTMRSLSPAARAALRDRLARLVEHIAEAHGMTGRLTIHPGFPVTLCAPQAVDLAQAVTADLFGATLFHRLPAPIMGAEDFSYVLERTPGAMLFLGAAPEGVDAARQNGIHSPRMMVDEAVLPRGSALLAGLAQRFLEQGFPD
jgi:amidohydrolase